MGASARGNLSCATLLLGRPGNFHLSPSFVNTQIVYGWTALHAAAAAGHLRMCGVLIQAGALVTRLYHGCTPRMMAQERHPDNAALLQLLSGADWVGLLPGTACERCATVPDSALMHCGGCHSVRYCCPRCAAADWPRHAAFCKERRKAREEALRM